jgi:hypothetical protein
VYATVDLDGEATFHTAKIEHEWPNGMLPAKLQTVKPTTAKFLPKNLLSPRFPAPQLTRSRHIVVMKSLRGVSLHGASFARLSYLWA